MRARVIPILGHPYPEALTPADMLPWASVPERNRQQLASGSAVRGPLADAPLPRRRTSWPVCRPIRNPRASAQFFPIFCGDAWWGYAGFDDCQRPRAWEETEVAMLRTAADLFGGTLQRWQAEHVSRQRAAIRVHWRSSPKCSSQVPQTLGRKVRS